MHRNTLVMLMSLFVLTVSPMNAAGQFSAGIVMSDVRPTTGLGTCVLTNQSREETVLAVLDTRPLEQETAQVVLLHMQEAVSLEANAQPTDIDAQYALAAVLGSRAEVEGGRTLVKTAQALHAQTLHVLSLDPDHGGAQYLMGRLHAGVMRMDRVTRFVAIRLLGGGALSGASWGEARARLEAAVMDDPCVPDHHYELARLYAERGDRNLAISQLEQLDDLTPSAPFASVFERASELLDELRLQSAGSD